MTKKNKLLAGRIRSVGAMSEYNSAKENADPVWHLTRQLSHHFKFVCSLRVWESVGFSNAPPSPISVLQRRTVVSQDRLASAQSAVPLLKSLKSLKRWDMLPGFAGSKAVLGTSLPLRPPSLCFLWQNLLLTITTAVSDIANTAHCWLTVCLHLG